MKHLKQFAVIIAISFIGEILNLIIPLPIPASIYGMALLFILLSTGLIRIESVKGAAKFLIEIMPIMFIPAGVGLMAKWADLKSFLLPIAVITVVSTVVVMAVSGKVAQLFIDAEDKGSKRESEVNGDAE